MTSFAYKYIVDVLSPVLAKLTNQSFEEFLSKVIEKLIHARITKFFERFNLFFKNQFGFLKKRSTNDAIGSYLNSPSFVTQPSMKRDQQQLYFSTSVKILTPLTIIYL